MTAQYLESWNSVDGIWAVDDMRDVQWAGRQGPAG